MLGGGVGFGVGKRVWGGFFKIGGVGVEIKKGGWLE